LTTKTSRTTTVSKVITTVDWFKWPQTTTTSLKKEQPDYYEDVYLDWPDYLATNKIHALTTSRIMTTPLASVSPREQPYQQTGLFRTKSNWQFNDRVKTMNTSPPKRHNAQQNKDTIGERNALGIVQSNSKIYY
jgi:hypothetical protein